MAESDVPNVKAETVNGGDEKKRLKYLDFMQVAAIYVVVCFTTLYDFAKDNAGPLKPGVETVEQNVKTVVAPVCDKFHDVPFQLLKYVDTKVEKSIEELERHVPSLVKHVSEQARAVAHEVPRAGVVDVAKSMATKYELLAEHYALSAWRALNKLPLVPQVAEIVVPTAAFWAEKYNRTVSCSAERGYAIAEYMPLVPVEKIAKVFDDDDYDDKCTTRMVINAALISFNKI